MITLFWIRCSKQGLQDFGKQKLTSGDYQLTLALSRTVHNRMGVRCSDHCYHRYFEIIEKMRALNGGLRSVLDFLDEAFDKKSWHGPNLRSSIRGVTVAEAAWRPAPGHHNIWELTLHAAYWKYVVRRRITDEKRGSFALDGSNFFERPVVRSEAAWKQEIGILVDAHRSLRLAVIQLPAKMRASQKEWQSTLHLLRGAAAHDLYHAGQIRLLRRMCAPLAE